MRLDVSVDIPFPRAQVFAAYRDKLPEASCRTCRTCAPSPVTSRTDEGPIREAGEPVEGRRRHSRRSSEKFLSEDLLEWDDHATWDADKFIVNWRTVVLAFKDAVDSSGRNLFDELSPTSTRYRIEGELKVDAGKIRGVPRFLGGTISPVVETFLVGAIKPNLVSVAKGVEQYLRKQVDAGAECCFGPCAVGAVCVCDLPAANR